MNTQRRIGGHYLIQKLIGSGAMGVVFLALDERLDRQVAIKVLKLKAYAPDEREQLIQRFRQEARTIARLSHPHIVGLHDIGCEGECFYMVMEYVPGYNLQQLLAAMNEPLPAGQVLRIALQLAAALVHAHAGDVIHRDIKPANLLIGPRGEVKLSDFGIARSGQVQDPQGALLGSLMYAAPEQLLDAAVADARADIYSLGATLYELLTAQTVYQAESPAELIQQLFTQDPMPPQAYNPEIPEDLAEIVWKAIARDPQARYQCIQDMLTDLQRAAGPQQGPTAASWTAQPQPAESVDVAPLPFRLPASA